MLCLRLHHAALSWPAPPALAVPAAAGAEPDPIYAAIDEYRRLEKAFADRCEYEEGLEETEMTDGVEEAELTPAPDEHRTPEMVAVVNANIAARERLAETSPTTLAGLIAVLDYAVSYYDEYGVALFDNQEETHDFLQSLAQCTRNLGRAAS